MQPKWRRQSTGLAAVLCSAVGMLLCGNSMWIHAKGLLAQLLLHRAWEQTLSRNVPVRPWPWADTWPVARLQAEKDGREMIVLAGQSGEALAFGPGMLQTGAAPGQAGTCVLAAHRDTHFRFLRSVRKGDIFTLEDGHGRQWRYRVSATAVRQAEALYLPQQGRAQLALITCYPFRAVRPGTRQRYVVTADRI
ncbi:MAG: class GN sortase [Candidatus Electrothrix sp. YB6]